MHNPLPVNIKTIGDWIKIRRETKNLTSGHVAAKMGIAQSVVRSWECGAGHPDKRQLEVLVDLFGVSLASAMAIAQVARFEDHEHFQIAGKA